MIVEPDFLTHWKTQLLVDELGDKSAPLYVIALWGHCQARKVFSFSNLAPNALKAICRYEGEASKLRSALERAGFIDVNGEAFVVHEWKDYNAKLVANWTNGASGGRPPKGKTQRKPKKNPRKTQTQVGLCHTEPIGEEKTREDVIREEVSLSAGADLALFSQPSLIKEIFSHYRSYHKRAFPSPTSKSKEWSLIAARLREGFTNQDLMDAIDGCHRCPFNLGENDRQTEYLDLALIMRDGSHVSKYINVPLERAPIMSVQEQRTIAVVNGFSERMAKDGNAK